MDPERWNTEALIQEARSFATKKRLGQHFLVDVQALENIVAELDLRPGDQVIEIGPGAGFLTRILSAQGAQVVAVDLDRQSAAYTSDLNLPDVEVVHGDFLRYDLMQAFAAGRNGKIKIVGNVPYQITGLIISYLLGEIANPRSWSAEIDRIVLTVQKEVARRLVAQPGRKDFGKLSLMVQYFCDAKMVGEIGPRAFVPPPKVDSSVVVLTPLAEPRVKPRDPRLLKTLIERAFVQRRKMLRNSLQFNGFDADAVDKLLTDNNFDPHTRPECLSLQQFALLADIFASCGARDDSC